MLSLATGGRTVKEIFATFGHVLREHASDQYDGRNFSGHGADRSQDPNRSAIYLASNATFTPEALNGPVTNLELARPLVFLNVCQERLPDWSRRRVANRHRGLGTEIHRRGSGWIRRRLLVNQGLTGTRLRPDILRAPLRRHAHWSCVQGGAPRSGRAVVRPGWPTPSSPIPGQLYQPPQP